MLPAEFALVEGSATSFSINLKPGDTFTNRYEVRILGDTSPGTYKITSIIKALPAGAQSNILTLDSDVVVGGAELPFACNYAGPDKIISGSELITALQRYAAGEVTGGELIQVIQYYASGTPCDQPLPTASAANQPLAPTEFAVESFAISPNPLGMTGAKLLVKGTGIAGIKVEVFNLAGAKVFEQEASGDTLEFRAMDNKGNLLANGVYLYIVTVRGLDGEAIRSEVRKLVIIR